MIYFREIENPFIHDYLRYTEHTESPQLMQVWSAITCASACTGRHVWYPFGLGPIYGNMFVLLVGPPATRKSTAAKIAQKFITEGTEINIAPEDTAGQRQKLIKAIVADDEAESEAENKIGLTEEDLRGFGFLSERDDPNRHALFISAFEWGLFIGKNNVDLTSFLIRLYDGDDYKYQLRRVSAVIRNPIVAMLGCTTPTEISTLLPPEAIGQGFMSRHILVYADRRHKRIEEPVLEESRKPALAERFQWIWREARGEIQESKKAGAALDTIYQQDIQIEDHRFVHYVKRRQTHLMKLCMILALLRGSMTVEEVDVLDANQLLKLTEEGMPDALGEYGLSPLARSKQKMLEYLKAAQGPVSRTMLWRIMSRDMKNADFDAAVNEMINFRKVRETQTDNGLMLVVPDDLSPENPRKRNRLTP